MGEDGLYRKFDVAMADGSPVVDAFFILRPDRDEHARVALSVAPSVASYRGATVVRKVVGWDRAGVLLTDPRPVLGEPLGDAIALPCGMRREGATVARFEPAEDVRRALLAYADSCERLLPELAAALRRQFSPLRVVSGVGWREGRDGG